jgi:hypothetical protein
MLYLTGSNCDDTLSILGSDERVSVVSSSEEVVFSERPNYSSAHMGALRNRWASVARTFWPKFTHLWVVDSDVVPGADCLDRLLRLKAVIAGAWVHGCTPNEGWDEVTGQAHRTGKESLRTSPFVATMLGGCYLISRRALWRGVKWGEHPQGEDGQIARTARKAGIKMWADPHAACDHIMKEDQ